MDDCTRVASEIEDLRTRRRFDVGVVGAFLGQSIRVVNISEGGMQLEHREPLKLGTRGVVRCASDVDGEVLEIEVRIVWSRLSRSTAADGSLVYVSGAMSQSDPEQVAPRLGRLIRAHGRLNRGSLEKKVEARRARLETTQDVVLPRVATMQSSSEVTDLEVVRAARRRLQLDPDEALKWYNRARFAVGEHAEVERALARTPYRQEALAVWEFLERRIPLQRVAAAFESRA